MEPFFSVIIPTYNPKKYLPTMLESITHNECADKIEVIISDDVSTETFDEVLDAYKDKLNIRLIVNKKHMGYPRTGRQNGADVATGKWMCFADQDDYYFDGAFDKIYNYITENNIQNYLATDFIQQNVLTGSQIVHDAGKGWTHGKFYEKSFWDKYKIHYDNIKYCEDINLSTKVTCILTANRLETHSLHEPIYVWMRREDSLCDTNYFVESLPDYIHGTLNILLQYIKKYKDDEILLGIFGLRFIITMYHMFFYTQSELFIKNPNVVLEAVLKIMPIYSEFKKVTEMSNEDIIKMTNEDLLVNYEQTRSDDFVQVPFIEHMTFENWLTTYFRY